MVSKTCYIIILNIIYLIKNNNLIVFTKICKKFSKALKITYSLTEYLWKYQKLTILVTFELVIFLLYKIKWFKILKKLLIKYYSTINWDLLL